MARIRKKSTLAKTPSLRYATTFDHLEKIGAGGMGTIYRAVQHGANGFRKTVAIKLIHRRLLQHHDDVVRFVSEAKLVADLIHENILQVYQLGMGRDGYYIVMEYVDGLDLNQLLARHRDMGVCVSPPIAALVVARVAAALHHAHHARDRKGRPLDIVHRDVTPGNIMLTWAGVVKLSDFGIAKGIRTRGDREGSVVYGALPYMSPEQARYQPTTPRSDIYSLGLVAYELFTNHRVYPVDTYDELMEMMAMDVVAPKRLVPGLPAEVDDIIMRALAPEPADRWGDAQEIQMALETYLMNARILPSSDLLSYYLLDLFQPAASGDKPPPGEPP